MRFGARLRSWLGASLRRSRMEREMDSELRFHIERYTEDLVRDGVSREEAQRRALAEFGAIEARKDECREALGLQLVDQLRGDLRFAFRTLRQSPGFTAVAVLSLALGMGANTAIFSVIDALMLRVLPVRSPQQLVSFKESEEFDFFPYPAFEKFRDLRPVFSDVSAIRQIERSNVTVNGPGGGLDAATVRVELVSGTYFSTLGVTALVGRTLTADDDRVPGGHPVTVLSYSYWERRFARAPDAIGRTLTLNGTTYSILGVTVPGFSGDWVGQPTDMWIPIMMQSQVMLERPGLLTNPNPPWVRIVGRLNPGVTVKQAGAAAQVIYHRFLTETAGPNPLPQQIREIAQERLDLKPAARGFSPQRQYFARPLVILLIVVGMVLLIACANVANLLLARSAFRQKEMAVRLALGAGRARVVRQLFTESALLAILAGALGLVFAEWGTRALLRMAASGSGSAGSISSVPSIYLDVRPDARMLAFTAGLCGLAAVLFGLAPAFRTTSVSLSLALKGHGVGLSGTGLSGAGRRSRLSAALVMAQVALSLVLLIGAGLFVRTLRNLKSQDMGFDRQHVLLIWTAPSHGGRKGAALADFYETVQDRVSSLPGVVSASPSSFGLLAGSGGSPVRVLGRAPSPNDEPYVPWSLVTPRFFDTVGMRLLLGRDFTRRDTEATPRVAIVNESFARYYFADQNPIGKRFGMRRDTGNEIEIVGVVKDAKYNTPRDKRLKMIYIPYRQDLFHLYDMCLAVRTGGDPAAVASLVRNELRDIDRSLPVLSIQTIEQQVNDSLVEERLMATLSSFFGVLAVLLACMGLYGVMSYAAARRTNEIGIRLALGATRAHVLTMILGESLLLVVAGIVIGVPAALAATRLISTILFGVSAADPLTLAGATLLMTAVAVVAGFVPAHRAARVDPLVALRYE